jgi:hypothetical protein
MICRRRNPIQLAGFLAGILGCTTLVAAANSVTLAWDPSPAPGIAGYKVYCGIASRTYATVIDTRSATSATISGLVPGVTYYFAVTAYDAVGRESAFSAEIGYTVPRVSTLQLRVTSSRQAVLSGTGPVGYRYDVQASQDLKTWTRIGSVTADATGSFQFTDPTAAKGVRCYRLRQTSP